MMSTNPLISIIIPVYNCAKTIRSSVKSVLDNTFRDVEIILVDDGSTDESFSVCNQIRSNYPTKIRLIRLSNNKGVSFARNKGISIARGDYLFFLDADDCLENNCLITLLRSAENFNVDVVMSGFTKDSTRCEVIRYVNEEHIICDDQKEIICAAMLGNRNSIFLNYEMLGAPWGKLFSKHLINISSKFPEDLTLQEDLIFNLSYLLRADCTVMVIPDSLYRYKIQNNSINYKLKTTEGELYRRIMYLDNLLDCAKSSLLRDAFVKKITNDIFSILYYKTESKELKTCIKNLTKSINDAKNYKQLLKFDLTHLKNVVPILIANEHRYITQIIIMLLMICKKLDIRAVK